MKTIGVIIQTCPTGGDLDLAKKLHHDHCFKNGVVPDWNNCSSSGQSFWIGKAMRKQAKKRSIKRSKQQTT